MWETFAPFFIPNYLSFTIITIFGVIQYIESKLKSLNNINLLLLFMKSHFIPKMYLKGWQTTYKNRHKQVCVYQKNQKSEFKSYKQQVGFLDDYYTDETEQWLDKELENKTAPIFEKMKNEESLNQEERIKLAQFMFTTLQRVPYNIEGLSRDINELAVEEILMPFRSWAKLFGIDFNELKNRYKSGERYKEIYSELIRRNTYKQSEYIANMNWLFIKAANEKEFVTSDNPFIYDKNIGIGKRKQLYSYILFPISKKIILLCSHFKLPEKNFEECNQERNLELNRRIVRYADTQVYSSYESANLADFVDNNIAKDLAVKHIIKAK